jgi:hypothetical protein
VPPTDGFHKCSTGVQMNVNPKIVHIRKAAITAIIIWHALTNISLGTDVGIT